MTYTTKLWTAASAWASTRREDHPVSKVGFCEGALYMARLIKNGQTRALEDVLPAEEINPIEPLQLKIEELSAKITVQENELKELQRRHEILQRHCDAKDSKIAVLISRINTLTERPTDLKGYLDLMIEHLHLAYGAINNLTAQFGIDELSQFDNVLLFDNGERAASLFSTTLSRIQRSISINRGIQGRLSERYYVINVEKDVTTVTYDMMEATSTDGPWHDIKHALASAHRRNARRNKDPQLGDTTKRFAVFCYVPTVGWNKVEENL